MLINVSEFVIYDIYLKIYVLAQYRLYRVFPPVVKLDYVHI